MDLRQYERRKFAVAEILRSASRLAPAETREWQDRVRDLFVRLAEDRFNLVVVGRFSRGKSSLMNAIIGSDRLPVGIVPLTSVITTVSYGTKEQVVLKYNERILTREVPLDDLPRYVTQQGNPGNVQRIRMAEVQLRAEILRRGFYFVDTPGLGSAILENTRTTESFLPEADAFLVVTSYESPLSEEEMRFFQGIASSPRRIFVTLNKHDMVSQEERRAVVSYVEEQLRRIFGENTPRVFSVSARDGLAAKQSSDHSRLVSSGLAALEEELINFLVAEKNDQFLLSKCDRVAHVVTDLPRSPETEGLLERIRALVREIAGDSPLDGSRQIEHGTARTGELPTLQQLGSCEVCEHVNKVLWEFLASFQYDLSVNQRRQTRFAESGGLCSFHTWQYKSIASPYGICTGYATFLARLAEWFRAAASAGPEEVRFSEKVEALLPRDHCILCAVRKKAESDAISALAHRLSRSVEALRSLSALCLPHVAMLSAAIEDSELVRKLMEHEAAIFEVLAEDVQRFALKHDAIRRFLQTLEEETAADRALRAVAGGRNVNAA